MTTTDKTAAVLIYSGCIVAEVVEVASRLGRAGITVLWASPDGESVVDESGLHLTPSISLAALGDRELDGLIVPGGDPGSVIGNQDLREVVATTAAQGVVAGICAGVLVLGDAGVLIGRRITHNFRAPWSPPEVQEQVAHLLLESHTEQDRSVGVIVDDNVITALPNAAAEFSIAICQQLGVYDEATAGLLIRHLQGEFVAEMFSTSDPLARPESDGRSPTIRTAAGTDADQFVDLQDQLFAADAGVHEPSVDLSWPQRQGHTDFAELMAADTAIVLMAEAGDQLVGFLAGYVTPAGETRQPVSYAILRSLYVVPEERNTGAGSALIEHFIEWAREQGASEAHVSAYSANPAAHRLYERHGFASHSLTRVLPIVRS